MLFSLEIGKKILGFRNMQEKLENGCILSLDIVSSCQQLGIILENKVFKLWSWQRM